MLKKYSKTIVDVLMVLLGNTIYALAVTMFILPSNLVIGGGTGLALVVQHYFGIPIAVFALIFNILMFFVGAMVLGKKFAMTTIISTFYYPFILGVLQGIPALGNITSDGLISAIYAGVMIGAAIGIVFRAGASTGGMDIPPLVINKMTGVSVSIVMYAFDCFILLLQVTFAAKEQILLGILLVFLYTFVLDKVLFMGQSKTQVKIVSEKYEEINQMIIKNVDRTSTLLQCETGYLHTKLPMVLTIVSNRELPRLNREVQKIDPEAFLIVSQVKEVRGRGFTMNKEYLER